METRCGINRASKGPPSYLLVHVGLHTYTLTKGAIVKEWLVCYTVTYDLRCPSLNFWFAVLSRPDDDGASGCQRRIFIEEIEWSEEEAHRVARCCCVGDVF
ncbi:hypothetical protein ATANTOWER_024332 [Ataeniobius toweri]|uniref:Uncharacterized protein n=1 Tax=Ataeniobius toweri TaxID=208326 RepID=A0ABU7A8M6_9TELE|nr:hypothetical protein [Ataeniobius toweri]